MFISGFSFETLFLIFFSSLCIASLYFIFEGKNIKKAFIFLSVVHFLQSFSVIILGFTFKLIIGPDISLYLVDSSDNLLRLSTKLFNVFAYFNYVKNDNTVALGINFVHLFLFVFFYFGARKIKT
ncbi:hypothetical protein C4F50_16315 [Flavobacterium sp. KB82]|uniref:Uncharacterized protein n=1 Tax=Flavobacterium hungaricum TaxID=2082725 RepID=A0ABR9TNV9_9FLAO|nr:hypothetical protein [Flavobacterium hungaricum]